MKKRVVRFYFNVLIISRLTVKVGDFYKNYEIQVGINNFFNNLFMNFYKLPELTGFFEFLKRL